MPRNVGKLDRTLRIIIGAALLTLPFLLDSPLRWFGLIGIMPLLTGLAGRCVAYRWLGLNSCPLHDRD